jgi:hypothetical protein
MKIDVTSIFDLGASGRSNIAVNKDSMIGEAFGSVRGRARRKRTFVQ